MAYRSGIALTLPRPSAALLTPGARYPQRLSFGAAGLFAEMHFPIMNFGAELSSTLRGALAGSLRFSSPPRRRNKWHLVGYYYGRMFDNPHAGSLSLGGKTLGSARRNRHGLRAAARTTLGPFRATSRVDLYRIPSQEFFERSGDLRWAKKAVLALKLKQTLLFSLGQHERGLLQLEFLDQDLANPGRGSFDSTRDSKTYLRTPGRGQRISSQITLSSTRLSHGRLDLSYRAQWRSDEKSDALASSKSFFSFEHRLRLRALLPLWAGARLAWSGSTWLGARPDRSSGDFFSSFTLQQRTASNDLSFRINYGFIATRRNFGVAWVHYGGLRMSVRY